MNRYILYNKPKKIDLNNIPVHLAKAFSKIFKGLPYCTISLDTNYSGLVLFYQDETFDIEKTTLSDIEIYEHTNNNLYLKAHLNTSSDKINLHVIQGIDESNSIIGLEPYGLHFQAPASFFEYS